LGSLKGKAKTIEISPSKIGEDYLHVFFRCVCCHRKFGEADYRREDVEEMQKNAKPLCKNCAKFLLEWQSKIDKERLELKQKLRQWFDKYRVEWIGCPEDLTCSNCETEFRCDFQHIAKEFEELLKEEKEAK